MFDLLGRKIGMTRIFDNGKSIPITIIQVKSSQILRIKSLEKDKYYSFVLGYEEKKKNIKKPLLDFFTKIKISPKKYIYESRFEDAKIQETYKVGALLDLNLYQDIKKVDVRGVSKGKGFQGVIKYHGMHRGPMSHGSHYHRRPGSMGAIDPQRVFKGKKLPGKMGNKNRCVKNLCIIKINLEENLLYVKGAIPGPNKGIVRISKALR